MRASFRCTRSFAYAPYSSSGEGAAWIPIGSPGWKPRWRSCATHRAGAGLTAPAAYAPSSSAGVDSPRMARLEAEMTELRKEMAALRAKVDDLFAISAALQFAAAATKISS